MVFQSYSKQEINLGIPLSWFKSPSHLEGNYWELELVLHNYPYYVYDICALYNYAAQIIAQKITGIIDQFAIMHNLTTFYTKQCS